MIYGRVSAGQHASNLGGIIAYEIASGLNIPPSSLIRLLLMSLNQLQEFLVFLN